MAAITTAEIIQIVGLCLNFFKSMHDSGTIKHDSVLTPALDAATARIAEHFATPALEPAKKGA